MPGGPTCSRGTELCRLIEDSPIRERRSPDPTARRARAVIEYMTADRRGFWEERGYHNLADPWKAQRYSYQEEESDGPHEPGS